MTFTIPIGLRGGQNAREHWSARARRVRSERAATALLFPRKLRRAALGPGSRWVVTLTRISPRAGDDDGTVGRLKGVRDEVAKQLGIDDGDKRIAWVYRQGKGGVREHGVRVEIEQVAP